MAAAVARHAGARYVVITDVNPYRLALAEKFGVTMAVNVGEQPVREAVAKGIHPLVPVMLGEAKTAQEMARRMLEKGVYVVGFFYPVVPHGKARIRTQISAAHSTADLDFAIDAFQKTREEMGL